ncbi:ribonuclease Z, mitochondrial isoform X2 [Venturia canescens]|nr:ribonuclease Z, mitochondrial isoform X2 [Venturia canescens]
MPQDKQMLLAMQRQREKAKRRSKMFPPATVALQILGSGARGAPTSLYVSTDHTKYLFNCGEGAQRLAHENRLRLSKLEHIFVTTPNWKNMGGLPGVALTIQDNGVPNIKIHGPAGCSDFFKAIEGFVKLKDLDIDEAPCLSDEPFVDGTMSIRYVYLTSNKSDSSSESEDEPMVLDAINYYDYAVNTNGKRNSTQDTNGTKFAKVETIVKGERIKGTMAYVCKLHAKPGMLCLEKCVEKGVPPGPLLGNLKAGQDVTLPDGSVILSSDVTSPDDPGPTFIVLECPTENYLDSFESCDVFTNYHGSQSDPDNTVSCIVHFTPENVLSNPRYQQWMDKFPADTKHIIINEENVCMGSEAVHRIQHKLHLLDQNIFPFLDQEGVVIDDSPTKITIDNEEEEIKENNLKQDQITNPSDQKKFPRIIRARTLDTVFLRPRIDFESSNDLVVKPRLYIDETFEVDGFLDTLAELQTEINARTKNQDDAAEYPKIVMLGTGSSIPNKTRNTSGILLRLDEDKSIIFDCGEGTAGQLIRFYGKKQVDKILSTIKIIFVSHLHADHHIGLLGLLRERECATKDPVILLAPEQIATWLRIYQKRFESISHQYNLLSNRDFILKKGQIPVSAQMHLQYALGGVQINTIFVRHCLSAYGISVTTENGCKIVYSGDTMPCETLVTLGADCDLLIHEATMEDELEEEAKMKYHSTVSQAIQAGERMNAKFVLLTHFSQRYARIPYLPENDNDTSNLSKVGIAYDNMQFSISQLHLLPLFYPTLKLMFSEFRTLIEKNSRKRQERSQREKLITKALLSKAIAGCREIN